jgi:hypothetical protein
MNQKLKQQHVERLREDRFTRDVCPGVHTEDWVLACLYRHPLQFCNQVVELKPEYIRTTTGKALCNKLHEYDPEHSPSLKELDLTYGTQSQAHPELVKEVQSLREHIGRLQKIPGRKTLGSRTARKIIHDWCEDRRKTLNRKLSTADLERAFDLAKQQLVQIRQEIRELEKIRAPLYKAARDQESSIEGLLEELLLRTDRHIDPAQAREALHLGYQGTGIRARLLGAIRGNANRIWR